MDAGYSYGQPGVGFLTDEEVANKGSALVDVLSCVLTRLVAANDQKLIGRRPTMTKFHALRPPEISVHAYLQRILKFAACSPECFVLALVYIDRLIRGNRFVLSSLNVHRVIITSVMLAAKFFDDQYFKNRYYAQVGGIPCAEINSLELEFLFSINFSLHVKPDDFVKYELELQKHVLTCVGCDCGRLAPHVHSLFTMCAAAAAPAAPAHMAGAPVAAAAPPPPPPESTQGPEDLGTEYEGEADADMGSGSGSGAVPPPPAPQQQ